MESVLNFFVNYFKKDNKNSVFGGILIISFILILNYSFNFSDQYKFEKKIENLKSIQILLKDGDLDEKIVEYLEKKKEEIILETAFDENQIYNKPKKEVKSFLNFKKFDLLHYITSSWFFILLTLYLPINLIRRKTIIKGTYFVSRISTILLMTMTMYIMSLLYASLLEYLPIFSYSNLWINYILNIFSIFFVVLILYFFYGIINYGSKYADIKELEELNRKSKEESKIYDPYNHSELRKVIGEKNPLLWVGEILKYNFKEDNRFINIVISILSILFIVYMIFSMIYTFYKFIGN